MTQKDPAACSKGKVVALARALIAQIPAASAGSATQFVATSDGTTAAPAFIGTDANTGVYFPAANQVGIAAGGQLVANITNAGVTFTTTSFTVDGNGAITISTSGTDSITLTPGTGGIVVTGNVVLDTSSGTKIGTATNQKLGFFNATPVVQGASVADASGGAIIDAEARAAINALISRIEATGLIATV